MNLRRVAFRTVNSLLRSQDLSLAPVIRDFDARLDSPQHLGQLFDNLTNPIHDWIHNQQLFPVGPVPVRFLVERFYEDYLASPFRQAGGGSRFNNLLWLYLLSHSIKPTVIIDSGTYTGASAWALSMGSPNSPVFSFDIDMSRLLLKIPTVKYIEEDWSTFDLANCDVSRGLCYFDDHVDQVGRLLQAKERRFPWVIFDDDFPITCFVGMAHGGHALPKIEFALNEKLADKDMITWTHGGRHFSWQVDREYLDKGRAAIHATERLPNTSLITGIQQTPYRVVALNASPVPPH